MKQKQLAESIFIFLNGEGISFSEYQAQLCAQHIALMQEWNTRLNLTRITDIKEILVKHLLDSLLPTRWLANQGDSLDLGTGAGFPGIPIKIAHPELNMVLLESQRKKHSFLKVVLARLQLKSICAVQGRWEDFIKLGTSGTTQKHDLVTMRALRLSPDQFATCAKGTLRRGGTLAWWAGPGEDDKSILKYNCAVEGLGIEFAGCIPYHLPSVTRQRKICLWIRVN